MNTDGSKAPGKVARQVARQGLLLLSGMLVLVIGATGVAEAGPDKITSATLVPIRTPAEPIPAEALLDIAIPPMNDGLDLTDEDDTVFPEVRIAETIYFSNQLA